MRAEFRQRDDVTQTRNAYYLCLKEIILGDPERETSQRIWSSTHMEGNCKTQENPLRGLRAWWWGRARALGRQSHGPSGAQRPAEPAQRERTGADPVLCFLWVAGKRTWKKKKVYAQMTGQVQDLNLNASSLFVPGADGERMYYRSALFPPSPQIADTPKSVSGVSERHWYMLSPDEARETPRSAPTHTPPFPGVKFKLPSRKAEVDIQDCFWRGLLPIKTPTVGCLPSFHFSKGAKASFRK